MRFTPISNTPPQYEEDGIAASGFYIKFYESGTTTPTAMATDSTGATLLDKCELNTEGYPINGSGAVFIPHINVEYKIALFRNEDDANNNNLANAAWDIDELFPVAAGSSIVYPVDTVADLRLLQPTVDGQQFNLLEYHADTGLGGGTLYYDASDTTSADDGGSVFVTATGERIKRKLNGSLTIADFGGLVDGASDDRAAVVLALQSSVNIDSNEDVFISSSVSHTIDDDRNLLFKVGSLSGAALNFSADLGVSIAASNVSRGDKEVTVSSTSGLSVGDYLLIQGTVGHENYTPSRYTAGKFCAQIISIDGLVIEIDRPIDFIYTTVTVQRMSTVSLNVSCNLESASIVTANIPIVEVASTCTGSVGVDGGASFVSVSQAASVDIDVKMNDAECVLGVVANNISSGIVNLISVRSGGLSAVSTSKIFRANGIQDLTINANFTSSRHIDSGIEGARGCTLNYISHGGGDNFWRDGSTTGNRLESCSNSECDNLEIYGNFRESNDQCLEILAGTDCNVYGYYANGKTTVSTEGAVVFKGASTNCTFHGTAIGYNSRGLKVEDFDGQTGFTASKSSKIISNSTDAISVRDSSLAYDTGHKLLGEVAGYGSCISIASNSNGVVVDVIADQENASSAVTVVADNCDISVKGVNNSTNKTLASIGTAASGTSFGVIKGSEKDCFININGNAIDEFRLSDVNQLSGIVKFSNVTAFEMIGGQAYSNNVPTQGTYSAGDSYKRQSYNVPVSGMAELGRVYNGASWVQLLATIN